MRLLVLACLLLASAANAETPGTAGYDAMDELLGGPVVSDTRASYPIQSEQHGAAAETPAYETIYIEQAALDQPTFIPAPQDTLPQDESERPATQNGRPLLTWDGRSF